MSEPDRLSSALKRRMLAALCGLVLFSIIWLFLASAVMVLDGLYVAALSLALIAILFIAAFFYLYRRVHPSVKEVGAWVVGLWVLFFYSSLLDMNGGPQPPPPNDSGDPTVVAPEDSSPGVGPPPESIDDWAQVDIESDPAGATVYFIPQYEFSDSLLADSQRLRRYRVSEGETNTRTWQRERLYVVVFQIGTDTVVIQNVDVVLGRPNIVSTILPASKLAK